MQYGEALTIIGGLSKPSKMPWYSWSISARDCLTGQKLAKQKGTICSGCYAMKGRYLFPAVQQAHVRRKEASSHPLFVVAFATVLNTLIDRQRVEENRFRWFDSGDLQSVQMLESINQIALLTPRVRHWLPTREVRFVRDFLERHGRFAPNLVVRLSAPLAGVQPSGRALGLPSSTVGVVKVSSGAHDCRALADQENECRTCDRCWTTDDINYPMH